MKAPRGSGRSIGTREVDASHVMTIKRFDARRDEPERLIVKGLQAIGCQVLRIENPDLLILYRSQLWLIEVKSPTGRQTRIQRRLVDSGWPIHTVGGSRHRRDGKISRRRCRSRHAHEGAGLVTADRWCLWAIGGAVLCVLTLCLHAARMGTLLLFTW